MSNATGNPARAKCYCGAVTDTGFRQECLRCGLHFHGFGDDKRPRWGIRPPSKRRPKGNDLVTAGLTIGIAGAILYGIGFFMPAATTTELSALEIQLGREAVTSVSPWPPALMLAGMAMFGLGPLIWATGQIVHAIYWLQQEPELTADDPRLPPRQPQSDS